MSYILSLAEAAHALRCATDDPNMIDLLPLVDKYIETATGRDWSLDNPIYPQATAAARMLLVRWHEDPGGMAAGNTLERGLTRALTQLEALAFELETTGIPDGPLKLISTNISGDMAISAAFVLVFSHEMDSGATGLVTLEDANGGSVATTNTFDVTSKIMTITPGSDLDAASSYTIIIDQAPDIYGRVLEKEVGLRTA